MMEGAIERVLHGLSFGWLMCRAGSLILVGAVVLTGCSSAPSFEEESKAQKERIEESGSICDPQMGDELRQEVRVSVLAIRTQIKGEVIANGMGRRAQEEYFEENLRPLLEARVSIWSGLAGCYGSLDTTQVTDELMRKIPFKRVH